MNMNGALRYANLISGGASTCQEVLRQELSGRMLHGISKTVLIIAHSWDVAGIRNVRKNNSFPEENIYIIEPGPKFSSETLGLFDAYNIDTYHLLGFMPLIPKEVITKCVGLNQHLGPGGQGMFGERRVYAHMCFCEVVGRMEPIQVFCQLVHPKYDAGRVVVSEMVDLNFRNTPNQNAEMLLPIEHLVQIAGRRIMHSGFNPVKAHDPVNIARNPEEEGLLAAIKKEAVKKYPRGK